MSNGMFAEELRVQLAGHGITNLGEVALDGDHLVAHGADALRNAELIAILLRTGTKGASAIQVAEQVIHRFDSLDALEERGGSA